MSDSLRCVTSALWPGRAAIEIGLDVRLADRQARRAAVDHGADRRAVRFAPGRHAKQLSDGIGHALRLMDI